MSHYDVPEVADVVSVDHDSEGDLVLTISPTEGEEIEGCRFRQMPGLRSMLNAAHDLDAIFIRTGDEAEVIAVGDATVTAKLPDLKGDETHCYSVGDNPRAISVRDDGILLGLNAKDAVSCEGDEVDVGTLILIPGGSGIAEIKYFSPFDSPIPIPMGATSIKLRGKIKPTSRKTKSE